MHTELVAERSTALAALSERERTHFYAETLKDVPSAMWTRECWFDSDGRGCALYWLDRLLGIWPARDANRISIKVIDISIVMLNDCGPLEPKEMVLYGLHLCERILSGEIVNHEYLDIFRCLDGLPGGETFETSNLPKPQIAA